MHFAELITRMTAAVCRGDGAAVTACFTPDGVYHDCFYGSFEGPAIGHMVEACFHRDGRDFRWDIHDPLASPTVGYARYVFSYESAMPETAGTRAVFEGVAVCELRDGLLASYREVANSLVGLACLGFAPERIAKLAAREARALLARDEAAAHRGPG